MLKEALNKRVMNFSTRERQQDYFLFTQKLNNLKRLALGRATPYLKNSELTRGSLIPQNRKTAATAQNDKNSMNCISLIGMPGAGKSTLGVLLAKAVGYDFVDTDLLIQVQAQRTLAEVIAKDGFKALLKIEADVIASLQLRSTVIATGGSAIYSEHGMNHLAQLGQIVYLRTQTANLRQRIGDFGGRGIAAEPGATLDSLVSERAPLYQRYADLTVNTDPGIEVALGTLLSGLTHRSSPKPKKPFKPTNT
jgi:shikimate kinase